MAPLQPQPDKHHHDPPPEAEEPPYRPTTAQAIILGCLNAIVFVTIATHVVRVVRHYRALHVRNRSARGRGRSARLTTRLARYLVAIHGFWFCEVVMAVTWGGIFYGRGGRRWWALGATACRYYLPAMYGCYTLGFLALFCFFETKLRLSRMREDDYSTKARLMRWSIAVFGLTQLCCVAVFRGAHDGGKCSFERTPAFYVLVVVSYALLLVLSVTMLRLFLAPIKETLRHADQHDHGERLAATVRRNRAGVSLCCASTALHILGATLEPYFNPANTDGGVSFATFFTPVDIFVNSSCTLYTLRIDFVGSWLFGVAGTLQRDSWDSQKSLAAAAREAAASDPRWCRWLRHSGALAAAAREAAASDPPWRRRWWRHSGARDDRAATWWWPRSDASDDRATFAMPAAPRRLEPSAPDRASAKPLPARSSTVESFELPRASSTSSTVGSFDLPRASSTFEGANPSVQTEEALV